MASIDHYFFFTLYNLAGHGKIGDFLIVFFGEYFIFVSLLVFVYFIFKNWRKGDFSNIYLSILAIVAALIGRFGVVSFIRFFYHRPRPFLELNIPHLISNGSYSFPSGHTIFLFALATVIYFFNKKLAYFLYASGAIVGLARVVGGAHWPSDIFGGAIFGALVGLVVYKIGQKYLTRKPGQFNS